MAFGKRSGFGGGGTDTQAAPPQRKIFPDEV